MSDSNEKIQELQERIAKLEDLWNSAGPVLKEIRTKIGETHEDLRGISNRFVSIVENNKERLDVLVLKVEDNKVTLAKLLGSIGALKWAAAFGLAVAVLVSRLIGLFG